MNKKKVTVIDLSPPWFIQPLIWLIDALSYRVKVDTPRIMQNTIKCQVTLKNGETGVAEFSDYYDFDDETGEFSMKKTCLRRYQGRDNLRENGGTIFVKFPQYGVEAWEPERYENIVTWGEPVKSTEPYPFCAVAIKVLGIPIRYQMTKVEDDE